jgi:hypothetical protein
MLDFKEIYQKEHVENGLSYSQIRAKYNIPRGTWDYWVRQKLQLQCDMRKHRVNDGFFTTIDSEIKAYLLGFLYADGYICKDGRIGCLLQEDDLEVMRYMQSFIAPSVEIQRLNYQNFKRKPQIKMRWCSKQMLQDLMRYGFTTDKTHIDANIFSFIPDKHKPAFIRGYCDGNGSVRFQKCVKENWYRCSVSFSHGCSQILKDIKEYFESQGCECSSLSAKDTYYTLVYEKVVPAALVAKLLYEDANYYLTRKHEKAMQMIEYRTNTELTRSGKKILVV